MMASQDKRDAINSKFNCIALCNHCNLHITHEIEVEARRAKITEIGLDAVGDYASMMSDKELRDAGVELIQTWINGLEMKTRYNVRSMAEI